MLSPHNSQYLADPYTLTHLSHGIFIYAILRLVAGGRSLAERAVYAIAFEAGWEVLENTDFVIQRYRTATLALNYFGDSVMNSMVDVLACMTGFWIASRLPTRATVMVVIVLEASLAVDPRWLAAQYRNAHSSIAAIKTWQSGVS